MGRACTHRLVTPQVAKLWLHDAKDEWNKDKNDWDDDDCGSCLILEKPIRDKDNVNWTINVPQSVGNYGVLVLHDKDERAAASRSVFGAAFALL